MKVSLPPPLYLLRRFARDDDTPATAVRRYFVRQAWGKRSIAARLKLLVALAAWPFVTAWIVGRYTRRNGAAVRAANGRGVRQQVFDQVRLAACHGLSPREYYAFELYRGDQQRKAACYLNRHETGGGLIRHLERQHGRPPFVPMTDKEKFTAECRAANLPVVPIFLVASRHGLRPPAGAHASETQSVDLPRCNLFFKPVAASIKSIDSADASSAARWDYVGDDRYRGQDGEVLSGVALTQRLTELCTAAEYLIQPRLDNHPAIADLSNGALLSVTIQTFLDEHERPEVVAGVFHMAAGGNTLADNASLGGLIAAVDVATGTLRAATDSGRKVGFGWHDVHPDTKAPITGRRLPLWQEALDLARRAHAAFPARFVVGWDIALTPTGPLLIEGDPRGFVTLKQRAYRTPFGETRYGELFAHHIRRLSEDAPSPR